MCVYLEQIKKGRNPRVQNVTLKLWRADKPIKLLKKSPACVASTEHGGKKTREEAKSGVWRLERMKHGSGVKVREDKSSGMNPHSRSFRHQHERLSKKEFIMNQ